MSCLVYFVEEFDNCIERLPRFVKVDPMSCFQRDYIFIWQCSEHLLELTLGVYPALRAHDEIHVLTVVAETLIKVRDVVKLFK